MCVSDASRNRALHALHTRAVTLERRPMILPVSQTVPAAKHGELRFASHLSQTGQSIRFALLRHEIRRNLARALSLPESLPHGADLALARRNCTPRRGAIDGASMQVVFAGVLLQELNVARFGLRRAGLIHFDRSTRFEYLLARPAAGKESPGPRLRTPRRRRNLRKLMATTSAPTKKIVELPAATVRFCGDSGDGMQLAGTQLTNTSALAGNDIATFPDFPAEIRAPRGTKAGVSGFQIHFASTEIFTPGDQVDALVAMNPAALVDEPGRPGARRHPDRQQRRLRRKGPGAGRLQDQSAGRRQPRRLPVVPGRDDAADAAGRRRAGPGRRRKPTAAATSTPWAWCSGSTTARSSRRCVTSTTSSARCRPWPRPTAGL